MDLKEFVKETITQIVIGVNEINDKICNTGAIIPQETSKAGTKHAINLKGGESKSVVDVDFDVAITATETEGKEGGGGIKVASLIDIGGKIDSNKESQTISRVKFTLPLVLPNNK